jgi:DNA-binding NarL/FixJ family response regulator
MTRGREPGSRRPRRGEPLIRVVVADPVAESCADLVQGLAKHHDIEVAEDGIAATRLAAAGRTDVVLLDVHLPEVLDACRWIAKVAPRVWVIVLDRHGGDTTTQAALRRGAAAVIGEPASYEELSEAVRLLHGGGWPLDVVTARWALWVLVPLVGRPTGTWVDPSAIRVLRLRAQGLSNAEAARELVIREETARKHLHDLYAALREVTRSGSGRSGA